MTVLIARGLVDHVDNTIKVKPCKQKYILLMGYFKAALSVTGSQKTCDKKFCNNVAANLYL
jgi:hypothetical protein